MNWIYINRKRTKLNLDTFKRNVLSPIAFMFGVAVFFGMTWLMFLLGYAFGK